MRPSALQHLTKDLVACGMWTVALLQGLANCPSQAAAQAAVSRVNTEYIELRAVGACGMLCISVLACMTGLTS